jgi:hypothetical protein
MKRAKFLRPLLVLGIGIVLGHSGVAIAQSTTTEYGTDRPGLDRYNFDMAQPEPRDCQSVCLIDQTCRAWTFVRPGVQGAQARCWLKSAAPAAQNNFCCVSGVKQ